MSQIFKAILAALAVIATFGAVQLASGHDLTGRRQLAATEPAGDINRAAKADRGALRAAQSRTETVTFRTVGLEDTSVVVRVPVVREEARNRPAPAPPATARRVEECDRLRTAGQRVDRGRKTASARPLRDLIADSDP